MIANHFWTKGSWRPVCKRIEKLVTLRTCSRSRRQRLKPAIRLEALESRLLLSNLVWTNRGQASDNFDTVFAANAEGARRVVDAVLRSWSNVLVNLNQPEVNGTPDRNTINFTISMDIARAGFGGGANATSYAYPTVEDRNQEINGYPTAGTITLDRGTVGQPNAGWWIDPTPDEHSEFTQIISPFAARPGPAVVGSDIYSTINAEIVHVLGLFSPPSKLQNPLNNSSLTRLNIPDLADGQGKGFYYVFDGPSGTHLLSSYDSGGGGTDTGSATHTAGGRATNFPVAFTSRFRGPVQLNGSLDAGNAAGGDTRVLASDNLAQIFKDAFNYTVKLPSTIPGGTFNVGLNGNQLVLRGGPDGSPAAPAMAGAVADSDSSAGAHHGAGPNYSDIGGDSSDRFTLLRDGNDLVVTTDLGRDGPVGGLDADGDGNAPAFVTRIPLSAIQSLVIDTEHGDDTVVFDLSGGEFLANDSITYDGEEGADELTFLVGLETGVQDSVVYRSRANGSATLNITSKPATGSAASTMRVSLASVAHVTLDGGNATGEWGSTLLIDELVNIEATDPPADIPTQVPVTQSNFLAVTVLNANPVTFYRAYNPGVSEHFFTTSRGEFDNAIAHGFRDESNASGPGFAILPTRSPGAVPVFRLYNFKTGTHYLTLREAERDYLLSLVPATHPAYGEVGWRQEGTAGFIFPQQVPGSVEVFRLYNRTSGTHLLLTDSAERDGILAQYPGVWEQHGSLGFAFPTGFHVGSSTALAIESHHDVVALMQSALDADDTEHDNAENLAGLIVVDSSMPLPLTDDTTVSTYAEAPQPTLVVEPANDDSSRYDLDAAFQQLADGYLDG